MGLLPHNVLILTHTLLGDVSLSAEDKPPDSILPKYTNANLSAAGSQQLSSTPSNNARIEYLEDDNEEEEDQPSFLERHTSIRFLLAGGIAGAGMFLVCIPSYPEVEYLSTSFTDMHSTIRSSESILNYKTTRPWWGASSKNHKYRRCQNHCQRYCTNIHRRRHFGFLDW